MMRSVPVALVLLWTMVPSAPSEEIPKGFKIERYTQLWERSPFTIMSPPVRKAQASPFDRLFLTCWVKSGAKNGIVVQDSETNEVQSITEQPNDSNFRLVALRLNSNPKLVEALVSRGGEQGIVKFRYDSQSPTPSSDAVQMPNDAATTGVLKSLNVPAQAPANSQVGQAPASPAVQPGRHRLYPDLPRVRTEGGHSRPPGS
jgi:hypothetical protein